MNAATPAGEAVLGSLIEEAPSLRPDELPWVVRDHAARLGLSGTTIYLVDIRQLHLMPFPSNDAEPLPIDTTAAGRCYRESSIVEPEDTEEIWFPLLNGSSRLGVLRARCDDDDPDIRVRGAQLALLAAELVVAKARYGDQIVTTARMEEIALAAEIRWALIPPLTFAGRDLSIAAYLEPAYNIAGDTFDYSINANTAHVGIFDAVGHGLEASRIANMASLTYRHCRRRGLGFAATYQAINDAVEHSFDNSAYVTAQLATLDLPDGKLAWVSAGHPPPLLLREGQVIELTGQPALPAGIAKGPPTVNEHDLHPGDVLLFYSDGVTEARSPEDQHFGLDRVRDFLREKVAAGVTPPEIVRELLHDVVDHQDGVAVDDATAVLLRWR